MAIKSTSAPSGSPGSALEMLLFTPREGRRGWGWADQAARSAGHGPRLFGRAVVLRGCRRHLSFRYTATFRTFALSTTFRIFSSVTCLLGSKRITTRPSWEMMRLFGTLRIDSASTTCLWAVRILS